MGFFRFGSMYDFLPVSKDESKHKWPRFAFPEWPGGLMTTLSTFPRPPSVSESSESENKNLRESNTLKNYKFLDLWIFENTVNIFNAIPATYTKASTVINEAFLGLAMIRNFTENFKHKKIDCFFFTILLFFSFLRSCSLVSLVDHSQQLITLQQGINFYAEQSLEHSVEITKYYHHIILLKISWNQRFHHQWILL